jgi:hypothetical protein
VIVTGQTKKLALNGASVRRVMVQTKNSDVQQKLRDDMDTI